MAASTSHSLVLPPDQGPRLVLYAQTHERDGKRVSLLPLITENTGVTHVIIGCLHLHDEPGVMRLNDHDPSDKQYDTVWSEVKWLQGSGVKVLLMVGGASQGSFAKLGGDDAHFEAFYRPVMQMLKHHALDGIDLDIEEVVDLKVVRRLVLRLRQDMGPSFLVTMAPVATAMIPDPRIKISIPVFGLLPSLPHLSGFSYFRLESDAQLKQIISWYNVQFYCGWGDASSTGHYDMMMQAGWDPSRIVMGVVTNPQNGAGYVKLDQLTAVLTTLREKYPGFGGLMGWEYFNAGLQRKDWDSPHQWVKAIGHAIRYVSPGPSIPIQSKPSAPPGQKPWSEENVKWLVEMGVDRDKAEGALEAANGSVEQATELLFGT